jgi:hypothetical protein
VVRIARQPVPWFTDEEHIMAQARAVGVPTPEVLGVEHVEHDGGLLRLADEPDEQAGRVGDRLAALLGDEDLGEGTGDRVERALTDEIVDAVLSPVRFSHLHRLVLHHTRSGGVDCLR